VIHTLALEVAPTVDVARSLAHTLALQVATRHAVLHTCIGCSDDFFLALALRILASSALCLCIYP
jgi:hypothetical protein